MLNLNPLILLTLLSTLLIAASMPSPTQVPLGTPRDLQASPPQKPLNPKTPLRILPLGNSITWGYGSSSGNGYREFLLNLLPNDVTYIGTVHSGNMTNDENEGHIGAIIYQIAEFADTPLKLRPNVILLMAGTNDMLGNTDVEEAPDRLGVLIDRCVSACPDAVLLVAQLTPCLDRGAQARADDFNAAVPGVVKKRADQGKKVLVVEMEKYVELGGLMDGLHPSDIGYRGMAKAWYDGIKEAASREWVEKPVTVEGSDKVEEL